MTNRDWSLRPVPCDPDGPVIKWMDSAEKAIYSLQSEVTRIKPFERIIMMSGQNIGLRLMDAEREIKNLKAEIELLSGYIELQKYE